MKRRMGGKMTVVDVRVSKTKSFHWNPRLFPSLVPVVHCQLTFSSDSKVIVNKCLSWKHSQVLLCWVNCHTRKIVNIMFPIYLNVHHFSIDIPLKCTSFVIILGQCSNHQRNNLEKNLS